MEVVPKVTFFKEKLKAYWNFRRMGGVIKKIPLYRSGVLHLTQVLNFFSALVNKGNCLFASGDYEKAREYYQEAYNVEASCTEALFNLGMTEKDDFTGVTQLVVL